MFNRIFIAYNTYTQTFYWHGALIIQRGRRGGGGGRSVIMGVGMCRPESFIASQFVRIIATI